jgi:hypothetical protein
MSEIVISVHFDPVVTAQALGLDTVAEVPGAVEALLCRAVMHIEGVNIEGYSARFPILDSARFPIG